MLFLPSRKIIYFAGFALFGWVFFKNAWVGDDAYILFRSLDQLLTGHGPRWNPHERVQVFTCPLWYWLLAGMGWIYRNHYLNSILLSAVCNGLLLWNLQKIITDAKYWLLAVITLCFSQAFFDFTSSGLENPLVYCLLSFVLRFYLDDRLDLSHRLFKIGIATGLLLITRHDALLFVLPLLTQLTWQHKKSSTAMWLACLLPLTLWTLFSLVYYGFPLPNTAYAKLGDTVPRVWLLQRGFTYFSTSLLRDFTSIAILLAGIFAGITGQPRLRLITIGILLHVFYVVWIGGDFMRGRFFGWDVLLCTAILFYRLSQYQQSKLIITTAALVCIFSVSWMLWTPPLATPIRWGAEPFRMGDSADGITQERFFFFWFTRFTRYLQHGPSMIEDFGWCQDGIEQRKQDITVSTSHTVGMQGFCLGTEGKIIDLLGITDPLLARMPHNPEQKNWRAGHFLRLMPEGYCDSVLHHTNEITDPVIAHYYDMIQLLTQSESLFSSQRLLAIWQINSGAMNDELATVRQHLIQPAQQAPVHQNSCPFVALPEAVVERLRHPIP